MNDDNPTMSALHERLGQQRLESRDRDLARPNHVVAFVGAFAETTRPATVVDPFVTSPYLVGAVADALPDAEILATALLDEVVEVGRHVASRVQWARQEPVESFAQQPERSFELILLAPPIGLTLPPDRPREVDGQSASNVIEYLLLRSAAHSASDGRVLLHADDGLFWRGAGGPNGTVIERAAQLGLYLTAVVSVELGMAPLTRIATSFTVFSREPSESLFVARLDARTSVDALMKNLRANRADNRNYYLGGLVDAAEYRGWTQYSLQRELNNVFGTVPLVTLAELGATRSVAIKAGEVPEPKANVIVIPTIGSGPVLTYYPAYEGKGTYRAIELDVDPERAQPEYIAAFLSSELGKRLRASVTNGTAMPHLSVRAAAGIQIPLPALDVQAEALKAALHIDSMHATLDRLRSDLWRQPEQASRIIERVESAARVDPVRRWLDTLPYPLASILQRYVAHRDTRARVDSLKHFFEATAQFSCATILSVFRADEELFAEIRPDLAKAAPPGRRLLDRADFGSWLTLGSTLARRVRRFSNAPAHRTQFEAAAEPIGALLQRLSNRDFWEILDRARTVRNLKSHGGIESEDELRRQLAGLETLLFEVEKLLGTAFEDIDLVLANAGSFSRGVYSYKAAKRLRGAPTIFDEFEVRVREPLETDHLTFVSRDAHISAVVKLIPLVRIGPTPSEARTACYFFESRRDGQASFVSYHYEDEPRLSVQDPDLEELADALA